MSVIHCYNYTSSLAVMGKAATPTRIGRVTKSPSKTNLKLQKLSTSQSTASAQPKRTNTYPTNPNEATSIHPNGATSIHRKGTPRTRRKFPPGKKRQTKTKQQLKVIGLSAAEQTGWNVIAIEQGGRMKARKHVMNGQRQRVPALQELAREGILLIDVYKIKGCHGI